MSLPGAAGEDVVAVAADQNIVAGSSGELVIARAALHEIAPRRADYAIARGVALEDETFFVGHRIFGKYDFTG